MTGKGGEEEGRSESEARIGRRWCLLFFHRSLPSYEKEIGGGKGMMVGEGRKARLR